MVGKKQNRYPFQEPAPDLYQGEYNELLSILMKNTWVAVAYMGISVLVVYVFSFIESPILLAGIAEIPLFAISFYVVSPNPNLTRRLPLNWILTALLAGLMFAASKYNWSSVDAGNAVGAICWLFVLYWIASSIVWSLQLRATVAKDWPNSISIQFVASLLMTWGAILQITYLVSWVVLPYFASKYRGSPVMESLLLIVGLVESTSILRFLPIGPFLLGLIIFGSLRLGINPYSPISMDRVLPVKKMSIVTSFMTAIRIPVWIMLIILGFIRHFALILLEELREFARYWLARLAFIIVGLVLAPTLLYASHLLLLNIFDALSRYLSDKSLSVGDSLIFFLLINFLAVGVLSLYVLSIPLLSAHYRGETVNSFWDSLHYEVFVLGKSSANAVGQAFSLFGMVTFAIPAASLLPGGTGFGTFSALYTLVVVSFMVYYFLKSFRR